MVETIVSGEKYLWLLTSMMIIFMLLLMMIMQNGATNGAPLMFPVMYPMLMTGMHPQQSLDDQAQGPGIYAIQQNQFMGSTLMPLTYRIPT